MGDRILMLRGPSPTRPRRRVAVVLAMVAMVAACDPEPDPSGDKPDVWCPEIENQIAHWTFDAGQTGGRLWNQSGDPDFELVATGAVPFVAGVSADAANASAGHLLAAAGPTIGSKPYSVSMFVRHQGAPTADVTVLTAGEVDAPVPALSVDITPSGKVAATKQYVTALPSGATSLTAESRQAVDDGWWITSS